MNISSESLRRPQISIIGASEADQPMLRLAEQAGALVAKLGFALVTGGRDGIMAAAARGCAENGGTVLAVVPGTSMNEANPHTHYVIPTGLGWARNVITAIAGDIIIVIGGAAGTLSEIAFAWMYDRPILALSCCDGWSAKLAGHPVDHRRDDSIVDCPTIESLEAALLNQRAKLGTRWRPAP